MRDVMERVEGVCFSHVQLAWAPQLRIANSYVFLPHTMPHCHYLHQPLKQQSGEESRAAAT